MKILCISDDEDPALWDHFSKSRLEGIDLIISCGDLKPEYLRFLVTMANVPLLYVHGNHDECYEWDAPEGCDCIDNAVVRYNGVIIAGLPGCRKYREGKFQITEHKMRALVWRLSFGIRRAKGLDILVTHAPPRGCGDLDDRPHMGFQAFYRIIDEFTPKLLLHGHVHMTYDLSIPREERIADTQVINVSNRYIIEIPDKPHPATEHKRLKWLTRHVEPKGEDYFFANKEKRL